MNLAFLYFFLSMSTKAVAQTSLYLILIFQILGLVMTFFTGVIPQEIFHGDISFYIMLVGMVVCGFFVVFCVYVYGMLIINCVFDLKKYEMEDIL
ncbi:hypothetical protein [Thomasclavelia ramosa]|uniref:hypothetical protein n=1 Tax=Thomasclavelia ramosa TaxID=1547 RepID=UPI003DA65968